MKKGLKITLIVIGIAVVAAVAVFAFRGSLFHAPSQPAAGDPAGYTAVKVSRGDITATVPGSGQFEPNTIAVVRPDSNMPTRKVVRILVVAGQRVKADQALAQIDASGLDLDLESVQANYDAQKVKLDNLKARPADLDLAQAQASLTQAQLNLEGQQLNYDNIKVLADKNLASKNQLADAERQLAIAKANAEAAGLAYQNVKAQSQQDAIRAQESALNKADSDLRKAKLVWDSRIIRAPVDGVVAEINVNVGDMVGPSGIQGSATGDKFGPSTAVMTVVDADPMILQAQVNETDMGQVRIGQKATVTPTAYPDLHLGGRVTQIDLHAQVQSNVSVFNVSIQVPNPDGKLLWGMNADADISVLSLKDVLTLPSSAIRSVNGNAQVSILDQGKAVAWDVQAGASDGTRTQILAGLDEGQEVLVVSRKAAAQTGQRSQGGQPNMGQVFRVLH
jgi:HlyD family secretion protein